MATKKTRLDVALVERGLAPTRTKAQALVMARRILVNGAPSDKPGTSVADDDHLELIELDHPYVSRGGLKLAKALQHFGIDVEGHICADIGASTGGFTDVLLRAGAAKVYAVDVGYGQLDASLRSDPRVIVREKVNARYLQRSDFDHDVSFVSIDVSFISLKLILPAVAQILSSPGEIVALVKPQFEVGRADVGKGGIVRDETKRKDALASVLEGARSFGFTTAEPIESPIRGAEGNLEYLVWLRKER